MSNRDEAIRVIRQQTLVSDLATSKDIARKLEYAGLLAPDTTVEFDENGAWQECVEEPEIFVLTKGLPSGFAAIGTFNRDEMKLLVLARPADEIRDVAHAMLAAADEAKRAQP